MMFAKISNGNNFAGIVDYAYDKKGDDAHIIAAEGVCMASVEAMAASFKLQSAMLPTCRKSVGHFSMSYSPKDSDRLTDEFMRELAEEYMRCMGFTDTQYVIFRHSDREHPHVHVVYNRVNNKGREISDRNDRRRSKRICKQMTKVHGLYFGEGKDNVHRDRLKGKDKVKYAIYDVVQEALSHCHSWGELASSLSNEAVAVRFRLRQDGTAYGVVFTKDNVSFAGSSIDKSMSYSSLNRQLYGEAISESREERYSSVPASESDRQRDAYQQQVAIPHARCSSEAIAASAETAYTDAPVSDSGSGGSVVGVIAEAVIVGMEAQAHISSGGGSPSKDDDDDKKKRKDNKPRFAPYKRRR